jgi:hypothetical protein
VDEYQRSALDRGHDPVPDALEVTGELELGYSKVGIDQAIRVETRTPVTFGAVDRSAFGSVIRERSKLRSGAAASHEDNQQHGERDTYDD